MNMNDFPTKTKYSLSTNPLQNPWTKKKGSFGSSRQKSFDSQRSFDHEDVSTLNFDAIFKIAWWEG